MRAWSWMTMLCAAAVASACGTNDMGTPADDAGTQKPTEGGVATAPADGGAPRNDGVTVATDGATPEADAARPGADGGARDAGSPSGAIVGGYYPNWTEAPVRIRDVDAHYNLIYLFAAKPVGGAPGTTGAVEWSPPGDGRGAATNLKPDIAYARKTQGRRILLSVGGAKAGMSFPNRPKSQAFVDSVIAIVDLLGGLDGLDWNTFEGSQAPDTGEMIWMSLQLKSHYPGFLITAPPAPWNEVDKTVCSRMVEAGALDYAAPQYYDGPNLATRSYVEGSVDAWAALLGEEHVVVGFGIWDQPNYMAIAEAVATWKAIEAKHLKLRGAFDWQIHVDEAQGWPFAKQVGPLVGR